MYRTQYIDAYDTIIHYKHEWLVVLYAAVTVAPCFFQCLVEKTQFPTRISCTHFSFSTYITNTPNRDNLVFCDHPYPSTISERSSRKEHISFYNFKNTGDVQCITENRGRLVDCVYLYEYLCKIYVVVAQSSKLRKCSAFKQKTWLKTFVLFLVFKRFSDSKYE